MENENGGRDRERRLKISNHDGDDLPQNVPAIACLSLWHRRRSSRGGGGPVAAAGPAAATIPATGAEQGCVAPCPVQHCGFTY